MNAETDLPKAKRTVAILLLTWVMAFVDRMVILLLIPSIKTSLGISDTQIGLLYGTAFSLVFVLAGLVLGRMVDRVSRRNLLVAGLLGWSIGTIACGLTHSFNGLLAGRMIVGVSQAVLAPASLSLVADLFPASGRGKPTSLLVASASFGAALSNILGGVLLQIMMKRPLLELPVFGVLTPWQTTFVVAGIPGLALALLFVLVPEPPRRRTARGAVNKDGFKTFVSKNAAMIGLFFAGAASMYIVAYGLSAWYPVVLMRNSGLMPAQAGVTMGVIVIVAAVVAGGAGGWLSDRFAARDPATGRFQFARIILCCEFVILLALLLPRNLPLMLISFGLFAVLSTVASACGFTVLSDVVPSEYRGQTVAIYQLVASLAGLGLGPTLIGLFTDRVLVDETRLPISMLAIALPAIGLAFLFFTLVLSRIRAFRAEQAR